MANMYKDFWADTKKQLKLLEKEKKTKHTYSVFYNGEPAVFMLTNITQFSNNEFKSLTRALSYVKKWFHGEDKKDWQTISAFYYKDGIPVETNLNKSLRFNKYNQTIEIRKN